MDLLKTHAVQLSKNLKDKIFFLISKKLVQNLLEMD
jgi:hypothetical protein